LRSEESWLDIVRVKIYKKQVSKSFHIAEPCLENWNSMDDVACGKFCHKCEKSVYDFVGKKESEIISVLEANNGSTCGRIEQKKSTLFQLSARSAWKYFLAFVIIGYSQIKQSIAQIVDEKGVKEDEKRDSIKRTNEFKGTIRDEADHYELPFATIVVTNSQGTLLTGAVTDVEGKFKFELDTSGLKEITLSIKYLGYQDTSFTIPIFPGTTAPLSLYAEATNPLDIQLIPLREIKGNMILGAMISIPEEPRIILDNTGNIKSYSSEEIERLNMGRE